MGFKPFLFLGVYKITFAQVLKCCSWNSSVWKNYLQCKPLTSAVTMSVLVSCQGRHLWVMTKFLVTVLFSIPISSSILLLVQSCVSRKIKLVSYERLCGFPLQLTLAESCSSLRVVTSVTSHCILQSAPGVYDRKRTNLIMLSSWYHPLIRINSRWEYDMVYWNMSGNYSIQSCHV